MSQIYDWNFQEQSYAVETFSKKRVDLGLPTHESLRQIQITECQMLVLSESGKIYRQLFEGNCSFERIEAPVTSGSTSGLFNIFATKQEDVIDVFHLDPTGRHCVFLSRSDQVYYWHYLDQRIRCVIPKFPKERLTALTFVNSTDTETTFLFSTKTRELFFARLSAGKKKAQEIDFFFYQIDVQLPKNPLTKILTFQIDHELSQYNCVLVCDDQSFGYFYDDKPIPNMFEKYKSNQVSEEEIPINPPGDVKICMAVRSIDKKPQSILYTTGKTLIYLTIPQRELPTDQFLKNFKFLHYSKEIDDNYDTRKDRYLIEEKVTHIAITEFHYFLLHEDCLTIMTRLNSKVVSTFKLGDLNGPVIDMIFDESSGQRSLVIYSSQRIMKISITDEENYVCEEAIKGKNIKLAWEIAKRNRLSSFPYVAGLYADVLFDKEKFEAAAKQFINSSRSFEEVSIKFLTNPFPNAIDGFIIYLQAVSNRLKDNSRIQRRIIDGISLEMYNYKLNVLEKQLEVAVQEEQFLKLDLKATASRLVRDNLKQFKFEFDEFMKQKLYQQNSTNPTEAVVDLAIVYEIMQSHGRINDCLAFAKQQCNYENVIIHYINEQNFAQAVKYLNKLKQQNPKQAEETASKFAYILVQKEPAAFFQFVLDCLPDFLPSKIISGLMNVIQQPSAREHTIKFLSYCIRNSEKNNPILHKLYVFFLSNQIKDTIEKKEEPLHQLVTYLDQLQQTSTEQQHSTKQQPIPLDLGFALQVFKENNIVEAMVKTYALMNLYEQAVKLALDKNNLALAKIYAGKHPLESSRFKLWLSIAIHMIKTQQSESVLQLTREGQSCLKVEDLLPYFGEVHQIDMLKEQICKNLQEYNDDIELLKQEIDSLTIMSDQLKRNINTHSHNSLTLEGTHDCYFCNKNLIKQDHYFFPCLHGFHRNCLVSQLALNLRQVDSQNLNDSNNKNYHTLKKVIKLNDQLNKLELELKHKQGEGLQQLKLQLMDEQSNSYLSKFMKGLGGAFSGTTGSTNTDQSQSTAESIKRRIEKQQQQNGFEQLFSPEDQAIFKKNQRFVDSFLSQECYHCGQQSVDRVYTPFSINTIDSWETN